jgi:hypothetical protein
MKLSAACAQTFAFSRRLKHTYCVHHSIESSEDKAQSHKDGTRSFFVALLWTIANSAAY